MLFLLRWLELRFIIFHHSLEIFIGFIAVIFTIVGIWLALKLSKPTIETVVVEKEVYINNTASEPGPQAGFIVNSSLIKQLELSKRELQILNLMAKGQSNKEIAAELFIFL